MNMGFISTPTSETPDTNGDFIKDLISDMQKLPDFNEATLVAFFHEQLGPLLSFMSVTMLSMEHIRMSLEGYQRMKDALEGTVVDGQTRQDASESETPRFETGEDKANSGSGGVSEADVQELWETARGLRD